MRVWKGVIVLPLCVCLLAMGSARGDDDRILSVSASETERLRDLLSGKRINATLTDGTHLRGRVKEIQDGFLVVGIKKSTGDSPVPHGFQSLTMDRLYNVKFARAGNKRAHLFRKVSSLVGLGLCVAVVATAGSGWSGSGGSSYQTVAYTGIGTTIFSTLWGRKKGKRKIVTLVIK